MRTFLMVLLAGVALVSCKQEPKEMAWNYSHTIDLNGVNPIGIAQGENGLWLSDGDHNRVVLVDDKGVIQETIDSLDRPMHIATTNATVVIPQYGNDQIVAIHENERKAITPSDSLDAPAGVAIRGSEVAIADFYNNRILYNNEYDNWTSFGKEGNADGDFYYPTDVQITADKIWVADAYNNRVQAFDKQGNHLKTIGEDQKMNAATGIYVFDESLFVTDFENDRVLVFDTAGNYLQEIKMGISKPTDMLLYNDKLVVANYKGSDLAVYEWSEKEEEAHQEEEQHHDHDDHHEE